MKKNYRIMCLVGSHYLFCFDNIKNPFTGIPWCPVVRIWCLGSIPDWGTKIPQATWCGRGKKKLSKYSKPIGDVTYVSSDVSNLEMSIHM